MLQHSVSLTHVCNVHCVRTTNVSEYTELNKQQTNKDKAQNKMEKEISLKKNNRVFGLHGACNGRSPQRRRQNMPVMQRNN